MLAELRITPVQSDVSFARMIADIVRILDASPLQYQTHAMGSAIEGDIDDILEVVRRAHQVVRAHSGRVLIELAIDDRDAAPGELVRSLQHVEQLAGRRRAERIEEEREDASSSLTPRRSGSRSTDAPPERRRECSDPP